MTPLLGWTFANRTRAPMQIQNQAPIVRIVAPKNNSVHEWNALVTYSVSVTDAEDGESRFDEIPSNEIVVEIRFVPRRRAQPQGQHDMKIDSLSLENIASSGCFTCHSMRSRAMGPSFEEISRKYSGTSSAGVVAGRIRNGSTGIWGAAKMPAHPGLTDEAAGQLVEWILRNGRDRDLNYSVGAEGAFKIERPSEGAGTLKITASYIDRGLKDGSGARRKGRDAITIRGK